MYLQTAINEEMASQGAGTNVRNKIVPNAAYGVIWRVVIIKPVPVLFRNEVPRERVQHPKIILYRNCVLAILQGRQNKLLTIFVQQPADGVAIRGCEQGRSLFREWGLEACRAYNPFQRGWQWGF